MKMSRIQKEKDNISIAETCSPTDRLHFTVERNDCIDVANHTENGCAHSGISLLLLLKYHGSFITNPSMTLTPVLNMLLQTPKSIGWKANQSFKPTLAVIATAV